MTAPRLLLVVDDDPDIRDTLTDVLAEEGFAVATAPNGREAHQLLQRGLMPALILLDMMMPVMDGWQFRDQQLSTPELASIPVVILSAHSTTPELIEKTRPAAVLKKPLRLGVLLATLQGVLEGAPASLLGHSTS